MNFKMADKLKLEHGIEFLTDGMEEMHKISIIEQYTGKKNVYLLRNVQGLVKIFQTKMIK
jgi:hypothetical protein